MNAHEVASRPAPSPAEEKEFKDGLVEAIPYVPRLRPHALRLESPGRRPGPGNPDQGLGGPQQLPARHEPEGLVSMIARNQFYSEKRRSWRSVAWDGDLAEARLVAPATQGFNVDLTDLRLGLDRRRSPRSSARRWCS